VVNKKLFEPGYKIVYLRNCAIDFETTSWDWGETSEVFGGESRQRAFMFCVLREQIRGQKIYVSDPPKRFELLAQRGF